MLYYNTTLYMLNPGFTHPKLAFALILASAVLHVLLIAQQGVVAYRASFGPSTPVRHTTESAIL